MHGYSCEADDALAKLSKGWEGPVSIRSRFALTITFIDTVRGLLDFDSMHEEAPFTAQLGEFRAAAYSKKAI